jgi:hypothetical protein
VDLTSLPLDFKDVTPGAFLVAILAGVLVAVGTKRPGPAFGIAIGIFALLVALQIVVKSSPTPTLVPTPTPPATDSAGCSIPSKVDWQNHEPIADHSIDPTFGPCQTLMVSSRSLQVPGGPYCDHGAAAVCVLVVRHGQLNSAEQVTGLTPFSWYGLTTAIPADAIRDKRTDSTIGWFSPDNCSGGRCSEAVVFTINPDGTVHEDNFTGPP